MPFKFSVDWLSERVELNLSIEEITEQLTMLGLEADAIEPVAGRFTQVVVGKIVKADQHPNADRLRVCQVDINPDGQTDKPLLTIVCGAKNAVANKKYPVILVGGTLSGRKIKKSKLRGVESQGMLCSAEELGLTGLESVGGILELADDAPLGMSFRDYLALDDVSLELSITPNRADCLSILGIARELAARNNCIVQPIKPPMPATIAYSKDCSNDLSITLESAEACPRYVGCAIYGINPQATTPDWIKERLRRSGLRSISPVVDITNYVMLELGQPMHAFDLNKVQTGITVRYAREGERLRLLGGEEVTLDAKTQIISDAAQPLGKPLALAGVMGGEDAGVTADTTAIFLESAFFSPLSVIHSARRYRILSDSAYRFERGVDPNLQYAAIERAIALLLPIVGGEPGQIIEKTDSTHLPQPAKILLRAPRIERVLGSAWTEKRVETILYSLEMELSKVADGWEVIPPAYRFDIAQEIDLIEELVRLDGYNNLPKTQATFKTNCDTLASESQNSELRLAQFMCDRGYHEAITYSFVSRALQEKLNPDVEPLALSNPMSGEMDVMRTNLWSGLISALKYNRNRRQQNIRLFEIGQCFTPDVAIAGSAEALEKLNQSKRLGAIAWGHAQAEQWAAPLRALDFFDMKGDIEALLALNNCGQGLTFSTDARHPALHPGKSAAIVRETNKAVVGYMGALHPSLCEKFDIPAPVYLFEIALAALMQGTIPRAHVLSKYPAIRRDIAIIVKKAIPYANILASVRAEAGDLLKNVRLFDRYEGETVQEDCHSLALGLIFQHHERTLVEEEVNAFMTKLLDKLTMEFGVLIREGVKTT